MGENLVSESIKGERSMSQGFVAQYAAEAALRTEGVARLTASVPVVLKESLGFVHEGKDVLVQFSENEEGFVSVTAYPVVYYGMIIPEVAWSIQERVKEDVEKYTGLVVESVNVHVCGVVLREEKSS